MRHKHADEIIAWANGARIQSKDREGEWVDDNCPNWYPHMDYRAKPETLKYRVALFKKGSIGNSMLLLCDNTQYDPQTEKDFIRWVTGWIEVEV